MRVRFIRKRIVAFRGEIFKEKRDFLRLGEKKRKEKREGRFLKKAWQKLSDASRCRGGSCEQYGRTAKTITNPIKQTSQSKQIHKTRECASNLPQQIKCRNQASCGWSAAALPGVQGGEQPPWLKLSNSLTPAAPPPQK